MGIGKFCRGALAALVLAALLTAPGTVSLAQDAGTSLVEEVLPHEVGENAQIAVEDVAGFAPQGGDAIVDRGTTNSETITYDRVDDETNRLIGLTRPEPGSHAVGAGVEAAGEAEGQSSPTEETGTEGSGTSASTAAESDDGVEGDTGGAEASTTAGVIPDPCDTIDCGIVGCETDDGCLPTIDEISQLIDDLYYDICGGDLSYCQARYLEMIDSLVGSVCDPERDSAPPECVDTVVQFAVSLVDIVCNDADTATSGTDECVAMLETVADEPLRHCPNLDCIATLFQLGDIVVVAEHDACSRGECVPDCADQQTLCTELDTTCESLLDCSPTPPVCDAARDVCTSETVDELCSETTVVLCVGIPLTPESISQYKPDGDGSSAATESSASSAAAVEDDVQTPSACKGKQDNVHESSHNPGTVSARAKTFCKEGAVPWIYVYAQLWEKHWWGYDEVGDDNSNEKVNADFVKVNAFAGCDDHIFRLTSVHKVTDVDDNGYSREIIGPDVDKPCGDSW